VYAGPHTSHNSPVPMDTPFRCPDGAKIALWPHSLVRRLANYGKRDD